MEAFEHVTAWYVRMLPELRVSTIDSPDPVFNLAGVGRSLFEAITGRDYVVIQGFTLLIAIIYVVVNLAVDISYGFLDPRVRLR